MARRDYTKPNTVDMGAKPTESNSVNPVKRQKIFISLPMNGRSETDVLNEIKLIGEKFKENYDIIDSYHQEDDPNGIDNRSGVWYLGNSLRLLRTADLVVFSRDWAKARGCIIEHRVCEYYDIPFIELI